jgi:hypothetical protein
MWHGHPCGVSLAVERDAWPWHEPRAIETAL